MDEVMKNKSGLELVTSRSSVYQTSSQNYQFFLLVMYYLTKFDGAT